MIKAAIYQVNASQINTSDEAVDRLAKIEQVLRGLGKGAVDILVMPELFMQGYAAGTSVDCQPEASDGTFSKAMAALARTWGIALLYGYLEQAEGGPYNSALCLGSDGVVLGNYRKRCIPPGREEGRFNRGTSPTTFMLKGYKVGMLVCYDAEFPELFRSYAQDGCDLLIAPTALGSDWGFVARKMMPTHAFENGLFFIYANYGGGESGLSYLGDSRIVSPKGDDLCVAGDGEEVIQAELNMNMVKAARERLPYLQDLRYFNTSTQ